MNKEKKLLQAVLEAWQPFNGGFRDTVELQHWLNKILAPVIKEISTHLSGQVDDTGKMMVTMVAVEGPDEVFETIGLYESLQAVKVKADTLIEQDRWPIGAGLFAVSNDRVFTYDDDDDGWRLAIISDFVKHMLEEFKPVAH